MSKMVVSLNAKTCYFYHIIYISYIIYLAQFLINFSCQRVRFDLTWNRTVNLNGGINKNDEMDLVNEFLNRVRLIED